MYFYQLVRIAYVLTDFSMIICVSTGPKQNKLATILN